MLEQRITIISEIFERLIGQCYKKKNPSGGHKRDLYANSFERRIR